MVADPSFYNSTEVDQLLGYRIVPATGRQYNGTIEQLILITFIVQTYDGYDKREVVLPPVAIPYEWMDKMLRDFGEYWRTVRAAARKKRN